MLFFVDILISCRILGLPYLVTLKIWSRRCYELTLKKGYQQLKPLVSLTLLVNANLFVLLLSKVTSVYYFNHLDSEDNFYLFILYNI